MRDSKILLEVKKKAWSASEVAEAYHGVINTRLNYQSLITERLLGEIEDLDGIDKNAKILDLGAGTGAVSLFLLGMGFEVDALDISSSMLNCINIQGKESRIKLFVHDFFDLDSFVGGPYDLCVSRWALGHFPNWPDVIASLRRIMRPSGYLRFDILSEGAYELSRARENFDSSTFVFDDRPDSSPPGSYYASASIERLEKEADLAGYTLIEVKPLSFFYDNPNLYFSELGDSQLKTYRSLLERCFQSPEGFEMLRYFESCITPYLEHNLVGSLRVTMRVRP